MKAIQLAKECAKDAIAAGGSSPTDHDGISLLPDRPLNGDWDYFYDQMDGSLATEKHKQIFETTYSETMKNEITQNNLKNKVNKMIVLDLPTSKQLEKEITLRNHHQFLELVCYPNLLIRPEKKQIDKRMSGKLFNAILEALKSGEDVEIRG